MAGFLPNLQLYYTICRQVLHAIARLIIFCSFFLATFFITIPYQHVYNTIGTLFLHMYAP